MQAATNAIANDGRRKAVSIRGSSAIRSVRLSITAMRRQTSVGRCGGGSGESFHRSRRESRGSGGGGMVFVSAASRTRYREVREEARFRRGRESEMVAVNRITPTAGKPLQKVRHGPGEAHRPNAGGARGFKTRRRRRAESRPSAPNGVRRLLRSMEGEARKAPGGYSG